MRRLSKTFTIICAVGTLFFNVLYASENTIKTEKIKIVSACCLNGKWTFNIYDGVSGKTIPLKLGKSNATGFKIETFDESTKTAIVSTPRERFEISMNNPKININNQEESESESYTQTERKHASTITRKEILDNIQ